MAYPRPEGILPECFKGTCILRVGRELNTPKIASPLPAGTEDPATQVVSWQPHWTSCLSPKRLREDDERAILPQSRKHRAGACCFETPLAEGSPKGRIHCFSYPRPQCPTRALSDTTWQDKAEHLYGSLWPLNHSHGHGPALPGRTAADAGDVQTSRKGR